MNVELPTRPKEDSTVAGALCSSNISSLSINITASTTTTTASTTTRTTCPLASRYQLLSSALLALWWPDMRQVVCPRATPVVTSTRVTPTRTWCDRVRPNRVTRRQNCHCRMRTTAMGAWRLPHTSQPSTQRRTTIHTGRGHSHETPNTRSSFEHIQRQFQKAWPFYCSFYLKNGLAFWSRRLKMWKWLSGATIFATRTHQSRGLCRPDQRHVRRHVGRRLARARLGRLLQHRRLPSHLREVRRQLVDRANRQRGLWYWLHSISGKTGAVNLAAGSGREGSQNQRRFCLRGSKRSGSLKLLNVINVVSCVIYFFLNVIIDYTNQWFILITGFEKYFKEYDHNIKITNTNITPQLCYLGLRDNINMYVICT